MRRIYSNDPQIDYDYVINPFNTLSSSSSRLHLAAPYFTHADPVLTAARRGKPVQLLVGLNSATSPNALRELHGKSSVEIRYFTDRFHAKIYLFDDSAMLGSSNLTDGGLRSNREAVIVLDRPEDADAVEQVRVLFAGLWDAGHVLTDEKLEAFATRRAGRRPGRRRIPTGRSRRRSARQNLPTSTSRAASDRESTSSSRSCGDGSSNTGPPSTK